MQHLTVKEKEKTAFDQMKNIFHYKNPMAAPKLDKVVINTGTGTASKKDKNKNEFILDRLAKITGQKPTTKGAKKSVASFKIRKGDPIGIAVTLRSNRMYVFLEKLINVALPRTKDFRGINRTAVDDMGNLTLGIKEHTIFPETVDEDIKDFFGFSITLVSSAKNKKEGMAFFELLGVPFKRETKNEKK
jgi:large subunit ribosomal protein L5